MAAASKPLVHTYGALWARNRNNIKQLRALGKLFGIYVLYDGSMPVYIGRGRLSRRIARHQRSRSRGRFETKAWAIRAGCPHSRARSRLATVYIASRCSRWRKARMRRRNSRRVGGEGGGRRLIEDSDRVAESSCLA